VSLILRLSSPGAGTISCGGVDLDSIDPREWRRHLVWVPQRPTLFRGSLAWNLRLYEPEADDATIRRAVTDAGLAQMVADLPDGLDTAIGDGGRRLSVGQAQRVALARALVSRAPMVLLDEPTAHLDSDSEKTVSQAIGRLTADRTALLVSHRRKAIAGADRVFELRDGQLLPFDPEPHPVPA
jgi:ATP-binding cassette subfamily C protein CydCD